LFFLIIKAIIFYNNPGITKPPITPKAAILINIEMISIVLTTGLLDNFKRFCVPANEIDDTTIIPTAIKPTNIGQTI
jgi:hypothetical protein